MKIAEKSLQYKEKYMLLRSKTEVFQDWPNDRLFRLAFQFHEKIYEKGSIITNVGNVPTGLHVVLEGSVGVYVPDDTASNTSNGLGNGLRRSHYKLVSSMGVGEIFDCVDILAQAAKSLYTKNPSIQESTVQIVAETLRLRVLELTSNDYNLIIQSGLPTIFKLYQLECQRNHLYNSSLQGWSSTMATINELNRNGNELLKQMYVEQRKQYDQVMEDKQKKNPSIARHVAQSPLE